MNKIRLAIVAFDDSVYLPPVFAPLFASPSIEPCAAVLLPMASAVSMHPGGRIGIRAVMARARMYGPVAFCLLGLIQVVVKVWRGITGQSLHARCSARGILPLTWRGSVNSAVVLEHLAATRPDIVLGVFSERAESALRTVARRGVLLLHYSLLPKFAGREPVFWTLLESPEDGGVTFFKADDSLDGGLVAAQGECHLTDVRSLHRAIHLLSRRAGAIAEAAVASCVEGRLTPQPDTAHLARSWPSKAEIGTFRKKGLRFI